MAIEFHFKNIEYLLKIRITEVRSIQHPRTKITPCNRIIMFVSFLLFFFISFHFDVIPNVKLGQPKKNQTDIGKSVRRRAASMETSKYEKRRGRVKKQVESMKNGGLPSTMTIIIMNLLSIFFKN